MATVTIFGKGNMGQAIGRNFEAAGNDVNYFASKDPVDHVGDIIVLAVPYEAEASIAQQQAEKFAGKTIIEISNPLNFESWDELVVPADSSAAAQLAQKLPQTNVVKGFNTNFAATLTSHKVGDSLPTTVQLAGDSKAAKESVAEALAASELVVIDAGSLKRARELEAFGFLQMTLAASEKISWNGGFGVVK